jgi:hypothetical protein
VSCALDDLVSRADTSTLDLTGSWSISAWIKPSGYGTNNRGSIVDKFQNSPGIGYTFRLDNVSAAGALAAGVDGLNAPGTYSWSANTVSLNTVQHVAVTFTSGSNTVALYVNGVQNAQNSSTWTSGASASTQSLALCGRVGDTSRSFAGVVDAVQVFDSVLTADQVRTMATSQLQHPPLGGRRVVHWALDDCQHGQTPSGSDFFKDRSGNGLHGTPSSATGITCDQLSIPLVRGGVW